MRELTEEATDAGDAEDEMFEANDDLLVVLEEREEEEEEEEDGHCLRMPQAPLKHVGKSQHVSGMQLGIGPQLLSFVQDSLQE